MSVSLYSDAKALWHPEKLAVLREGEQIVPSQVQLVISDLCNHDCSFCAYRMSGYESNQNFSGPEGQRNPNRRIETQKVFEILDDFAKMGVGAVQFTGGGEPTVHKHHIAIFKHALAVGLKCALVTNGQTLADGWEKVYPHFSWVRVSLDAGAKETHAKIRGISDKVFGGVLENIEKLSKAGVPDLGVSFIVTKENANECFDAALLAAKAGATYIRFAAIFSPDGSEHYTDKEIRKATQSIEAAKSMWADSTFRVVDMFSSRRLSSGEQPDYERCFYQEFNTYIGADLKVYRCCGLAYNDRGEVGSLEKQTFAHLWESQSKQDKFSGFDARGCRSCAYNDKNRLINLAVSDPPRHLEFV